MLPAPEGTDDRDAAAARLVADVLGQHPDSIGVTDDLRRDEVAQKIHYPAGISRRELEKPASEAGSVGRLSEEGSQKRADVSCSERAELEPHRVR